MDILLSISTFIYRVYSSCTLDAPFLFVVFFLLPFHVCLCVSFCLCCKRWVYTTLAASHLLSLPPSRSLYSSISCCVVFYSLFIHLYMQQTRQIFFWYIDLQNILALHVSKHTHTRSRALCVRMCVLDMVSVSFLFFCTYFFPFFALFIFYVDEKSNDPHIHTHTPTH